MTTKERKKEKENKLYEKRQMVQSIIHNIAPFQHSAHKQARLANEPSK